MCVGAYGFFGVRSCSFCFSRYGFSFVGPNSTSGSRLTGGFGSSSMVGPRSAEVVQLTTWIFSLDPLRCRVMLPPEQTPRQRIIDLITGTRLSSYQLAQMLGIRERQVEEHLTHVVKTIARDKTRRFILDPARCQDCDFVFHDRRCLTSPSRCPLCRSEAIAVPRYGIDSLASQPGARQ